MLRCTEPGWIKICCPDGRRGLWMRVSDASIELCAGREGDDALLLLRRNTAVSLAEIDAAREVLSTFAYARAVARENRAHARARKGQR
jgi:hypothetical protein